MCLYMSVEFPTEFMSIVWPLPAEFGFVADEVDNDIDEKGAVEVLWWIIAPLIAKSNFIVRLVSVVLLV